MPGKREGWWHPRESHNVRRGEKDYGIEIE